MPTTRQRVAQITGEKRAEIVECQARFLTGAFTELVFHWLDTPAGLSPADIDQIFRRLTMNSLGVGHTAVPLRLPASRAIKSR